MFHFSLFYLICFDIQTKSYFPLTFPQSFSATKQQKIQKNHTSIIPTPEYIKHQ
jgi:hypothetical protein